MLTCVSYLVALLSSKFKESLTRSLATDFGTLLSYKYTAHSAAFHGETELPTVRVHFDISPMHVVVVERRKPLYRFVTNLFAIIGGCFTVFGIFDSLLDSAHQVVRKKMQLGKQS